MTDFTADFQVFSPSQLVFQFLESMAPLGLFILDLLLEPPDSLRTGSGLFIQRPLGIELELFEIQFCRLDLTLHICNDLGFQVFSDLGLDDYRHPNDHFIHGNHL